MPVTLSYPGVYIEEVPSGVRTIVGVATSITVFIGRALKGPTFDPVRIQNFSDFERQFGGLWIESALGYAVQQYFQNGGTDAIIVRVVANDATKGTVTVGGNLTLAAISEGDWTSGYSVIIDYNTRAPQPGEGDLFNLTINQTVRDQPPAVREKFLNLSANPNSARFVTSVLEHESNLVRVQAVVTNPPTRPAATADSGENFTPGTNGGVPSYGEDYKRGWNALEKADLFNLMCIPPAQRGEPVADSDAGIALLGEVLQYCKQRRAMLIIDPPTADTIKEAIDRIQALNLSPKDYGAIYFPQFKMSDPLREGRLEEFPPSAVVAGIYARTDAERGVWKAPAGIEATLGGVRQLSYKMTDGENGQLNPLGINCLRSFPVYGNVVWGARTLAGADQLASEWKYIPVRRLSLFLEESLYRGTQWVVFEPNDEPLWSQIRLNIGAFMNNLFRQGAFQGSSPSEAYFVKCDKETTTQNDINLGIVNILVGFAPLKPAEFVVIKFQQIAGQIAT